MVIFPGIPWGTVSGGTAAVVEVAGVLAGAVFVGARFCSTLAVFVTCEGCCVCATFSPLFGG